MSNGKTLACFSGGGLAGIDIHAGLLLALRRCGVRVHCWSGTSAGAAAAAWGATQRDPWAMVEAVAALTDRDVRRKRFLYPLRPWLPSIMDPAPLERLLGRMFPGYFSEHASLTIWSTREDAHRAHAHLSGDLARAVQASMAVPAIWPAVDVRGVPHHDGGTTNLCALTPDWMEYQTVVLCIARSAVDYRKRNSGYLSRALYAIDTMGEDQVADTLATLRSAAEHGGPRLIVLRPQVDLGRGSLHFDHRLISQAEAQGRLALIDAGYREEGAPMKDLAEVLRLFFGPVAESRLQRINIYESPDADALWEDYDEGVAAASDSCPICQNPHRPGSRFWTVWNMGWVDTAEGLLEDAWAGGQL